MRIVEFFKAKLHKFCSTECDESTVNAKWTERYFVLLSLTFFVASVNAHELKWNNKHRAKTLYMLRYFNQCSNSIFSGGNVVSTREFATDASRRLWLACFSVCQIIEECRRVFDYVTSAILHPLWCLIGSFEVSKWKKLAILLQKGRVC